jgi:hypothetical protein
MSTLSPRPRSPRVAVLVGALLLCAGCGEGLGPRIEASMDGCLAQRRPGFQRGEQVAEIGRPLPAAIDSIARAVAYDAASQQFEAIAEGAGDQVTLICALDLMSRNTGDRTTLFLKPYLRHPNAEVASWARHLLTGRRGGLPAGGATGGAGGA